MVGRQQRRTRGGLRARASKVADIPLGQTPMGQPLPGEPAQTCAGLAGSWPPGRAGQLVALLQPPPHSCL